MTNTNEIDSLSVVSYNSVPVITTELLADLYGTERQRLINNFNRNKSRFVKGKHYFLLEGDELRDLKRENSLRVSVKIARNVRSLILWTERGAARHAKMLETDQAWEVFEKLEDCYFSQHSASQSTNQLPATTGPHYYEIVTSFCDGQPIYSRVIQPGELLLHRDDHVEMMARSGHLVIHCNELEKMGAPELARRIEATRRMMDIWA
ncbi:TPA: ORF6N domain-containing protein [Escherichia coli]|nr:ORF6N domain-containing protein [Escherichia coli]